MHKINNLTLALLLATGISAQSPCDWFDHDGDGMVNVQDILLFLTLL